MMGGVPGIATPLADDEALLCQGSGSVFGPALLAPDATGRSSRSDDELELRPISMGVAAAVRVASLETPGDDETFGTVRFESSSSGISAPGRLERCAL